QAPSSPMGSCGYRDGQIPSSVTQLGPFQYYSYHSLDGSGKPIPNGAPIILPNNVTFSSSVTSCQGSGVIASGTANQSSALPAYIFWGGMVTGSNTNFGAGQYVMAGTTDATAGNVFDATGGTITGDSTRGTMFIFTDGSYPGLQPTSTSPQGQIAGIPNSSQMPTLNQGSITFKGADITLTGLVNSNNGSGLPTAMDEFSGVAWWQDRRNST